MLCTFINKYCRQSMEVRHVLGRARVILVEYLSLQLWRHSRYMCLSDKRRVDAQTLIDVPVWLPHRLHWRNMPKHCDKNNNLNENAQTKSANRHKTAVCNKYGNRHYEQNSYLLITVLQSYSSSALLPRLDPLGPVQSLTADLTIFPVSQYSPCVLYYNDSSFQQLHKI
jgi:hypothetical protein